MDRCDTKSQEFEKIQRMEMRNDRNEGKRDKDRPFNESTGWNRRKVSTGGASKKTRKKNAKSKPELKKLLG